MSSQTRQEALICEFKDDYPRCFAFGILRIIDGEPRVPRTLAVDNLQPAEFLALEEFMRHKTNPNESYYAWYVERVLSQLNG